MYTICNYTIYIVHVEKNIRIYKLKLPLFQKEGEGSPCSFTLDPPLLPVDRRLNMFGCVNDLCFATLLSFIEFRENS